METADSATAHSTGGRQPLGVAEGLRARSATRQLGPVLAAVMLAALVVEGFMVSATRLWGATDSGGYIKLAAALAERLDFGHEFFQFRPPGYPILLALIFRLCGDASPSVLLVLQHGLIVGTAMLSSLIAWTLHANRAFALVAGLLGAFSLHLSAYASTLLTESAYAFVLTLCVLALVRFHVLGGWRRLAWASAAAGLCALTKAIGQIMPVLCLAVALHRMWLDRREVAAGGLPDRLPRRSPYLLAAVVPAAMLLLPVMLNNYRMGGRFQLSCNGDLALYHRAVVVEELDSASSAAWARVQTTLGEARQRKLVPDRVTVRDTFMVKDSFRLVHGISTAQAAEIMGRAGRELLTENPGLVLGRGVRYAYRTLFMPDLYYRVVPGEMPPEMFDMDAAMTELVSYAGPAAMAAYLPLHQDPTPTSSLLGRITRTYRRHVEQGPPPLGVLDTPYEEYVLLSVVGGLLTLCSASRWTWFLLGLIVGWHVVVSSYLGGASPRYAIPVHPVLHVFAAYTLWRFGWAVAVLSRTVSVRSPVRGQA
ncbi:MAG: glycosyltransferase family 39 protein [bacterium]|nr:glycosyltransferase family 39 protein [bacterium]